MSEAEINIHLDNPLLETGERNFLKGSFMKKSLIGVFFLTGLMSTAYAADRTLMLPIAAAMENSDAEAKLGSDILFYFGDRPVKGKVTSLGTSKTSQKANAFGKADDVACNRAFLNAMIQLQKHAINVGATAVVNIRSNYKNQEYSSQTEFECHAGALMAGVALIGEFVN